MQTCSRKQGICSDLSPAHSKGSAGSTAQELKTRPCQETAKESIGERQSGKAGVNLVHTCLEQGRHLLLLLREQFNHSLTLKENYWPGAMLKSSTGNL